MILLVDHYNIPFDRVSLLHVLHQWISALKFAGKVGEDPIQAIRVRAYGGWFSGVSTSPGRYEAADFYQRTCPSVFQFDGRYYRVSFEFADYQVERNDTEGEPLRITHSVVERTTLPWMSAIAGVECSDAACQLGPTRRWLRRRKGCPKPDCSKKFSDCFYRLEQKQVDVHMALDLQAYADGEWSYSRIGIASDDWDLLPALARAASSLRAGRSLTTVRFTGTGSYLDPVLRAKGVAIVNVLERIGQ